MIILTNLIHKGISTFNRNNRGQLQLNERKYENTPTFSRCHMSDENRNDSSGI